METKKQGAAAHVKHTADGNAIITLSKEYNLGGKKASQLVMREPTIEDQMAAGAATESDAEMEVLLVANLTMTAPEEVRKLTVRDYKRVQVAFAGFTD